MLSEDWRKKQRERRSNDILSCFNGSPDSMLAKRSSMSVPREVVNPEYERRESESETKVTQSAFVQSFPKVSHLRL